MSRSPKADLGLLVQHLGWKLTVPQQHVQSCCPWARLLQCLWGGSALNPEHRVGAFASLFPVLSRCFMRLDKFLSLWANWGTEQVKTTCGKGTVGTVTWRNCRLRDPLQIKNIMNLCSSKAQKSFIVLFGGQWVSPEIYFPFLQMACRWFWNSLCCWPGDSSFTRASGTVL